MLGVLVWGVFLAAWLGRVYFLHPPERIHENHEAFTYAGRLVEFRDLLAAGYLSPEWCSHFRGGLGAPYFGYYQPGFFYAAAVVPWNVPPVRALGVTVVAFALVGYLGMFALVARRFGAANGWLAASALLTSVYAGTEIVIRGDLAEFSGMMLLPGLLGALLGWLEEGRLGRLALLWLIAACLILVHPLVAMLGFMLLAMATVAFGLPAENRQRIVPAVAALGLAVGMTSFYWLPLFLQWDLVCGDRAFEGFYHWSEHFVGPLALLGRYDRGTLIPFSVGPMLVLLVAIGALSHARWGDAVGDVPQRRWLVFLLVALAIFSLLMTRGSTWLWMWLTPLQRLQFPWRILSLVSVLAAAAAGALPRWGSEKLRTAAVALIVLVLWGLSIQYTAYRLDPSLRAPADVEQLAGLHFAPDLRNEWLPRGAVAEIPLQQRAQPRPAPGCRVQEFVRQQGHLRCLVRVEGDSHVVLPHYFFPVGWQATLDGRPVKLASDDRGLMRVDLPRGTDATLVVAFSPTPARRLGLGISAISLLASVALAGLGFRYLSGRRRPG